MINKIRWRFVGIAMISLFIVLLIIVGGINAFNYKAVRDYSDTVLDSLADNGGYFGAYSGEENLKPPKMDQLTAETQYETRYFTVVLDGDTNTGHVDLMHIASVDLETAEEYTNEVMASGKTKGYKGVYRYLVRDLENGNTMVLFMDSSRQLSIVQEFMQISLLIALAVFLGMFLIIVMLSKRAVKPISESYEKQKRFITDASHELKTPLTIISANNELIEMDFGESESTRCIAKQVARMADMTKKLTMLAKIDESDILKEKAPFLLSDTVVDVAESYRTFAETKNIVVHTSIEDNINFIGDERLIRQMLSLMLDNALKYGKENINISLIKVKKNIKLQLKNDTYGIEQGNLDKYFGRFYRSDETRASDIEGSGIGLSIVKEIVLLHKGKITATGSGDEFIIDIAL